MKMFKLFIITFIFLFFSSSTLFSKELKKVTLQLSWFDQFQFAGYYIAKEKGFFKEQGLDVEIKPFNFGINVSSLVDEGKVDFGIDRETLLLELVNGKNVVALYALFQDSPLVLMTKKDSNINTIKDFIGKTIMTTINDAGEVSIKSMILSENIKIEELNFIKHSHNIMDLVNDNTDIISAYLSKTPFSMEKMGIEYKLFSPREYGFDMYSDFLFTNEKMIKNHLSTVLSFKAASLEGWKYAYENMDEAVDLVFNKYNSQKISLDELKFEAKVLKKLSYSNTKNLGDIKTEKIQRIYDLYNVMGLVPNKIDLKEFILDEKYDLKLNLTNKELEYIIEKKEVKMCILPNLKPFSFIEYGKFKGFISDYINLISKNINIKFKLVQTDSLKRSLTYLKDGKCDILSSVQDIKERRSYSNFTNSFQNFSLALVTKFNSAFIDDISILKDKKIGIYKDYSFNKLLRERYPNHNFVNVSSIEDGMKKVEDGELYAYIDFLHTLWNKIQFNYLDSLKISGKLDLEIPLSIAVNKKDHVLHSILNKSVNSITKEEIDQLLQKWITVKYKKEFDYNTLWKFALLFLIVVLAIVYKQIILKNMNKTLKRKVNEKTLELQKINHNLEERVKKEVIKNMKKDALLTKQSKMAAMGEMIQNIAHQWRQPLSIISTGASGLKLKNDINGKIDNKELDETLIKIVDTTVHLSNTINDFMYYFKPNKNKSIFSMKKMMKKVLNIFDYNMQDGNIKIIKDIEDVEIIGYQSDLIQVIMNILHNSQDAFKESKVEKKLLFIDIKKDKNLLFIKIKDNAGGVKEDIIDKIFEPYFTTKHQYQGTGIGLYMCQEILDKHMNGEIYVENESYEYKDKEYTGALFTIQLKIKE